MANRSGNTAKGPKPNGLKPKIWITIGFDTKAYNSKTRAKSINPKTKSYLFSLYKVTYVVRRVMTRTILIEDITVFAV